MKKVDETLKPVVYKFVNDILDGAGWCTDSYVNEVGECNDLTEEDQLDAMMELARLGVLYPDEMVDCDNIDTQPPRRFRMHEFEVAMQWSSKLKNQ